MTKPVPRSRLNITYRTHIDGVLAKKRLPLRILVLGDFTGGSKVPYEKRRIMSINQGTPVSSFMRELALACPVDDPNLRTIVPARVTAKISGVVKKSLDDKGRVLLRFTGEGTIDTDWKSNGLCTVSGTVTITGQGEAIKDKAKLTLDPAKLQISGTVDGDVTGTIDYAIEHKFDKPEFDEDELRFELSVPVPINLTIPIRNMNSFTPQHVALMMPEVHRLVVLRRLLGELRNNIAARPDLREGMKAALKHEELQALRDWMVANFPKLQLPPEILDMVKSRAQALAAA